MSCRCEANSRFTETKNGFLCYACTACKRVIPQQQLKNYKKCNCRHVDYEKWRFDSYVIKCADCNSVLIE